MRFHCRRIEPEDSYERCISNSPEKLSFEDHASRFLNLIAEEGPGKIFGDWGQNPKSTILITFGLISISLHTRNKSFLIKYHSFQGWKTFKRHPEVATIFSVTT